MIETREQSLMWARDTLENAEVVAAHERTMFLHKIATLGAASIKGVLKGTEERGKTSPVEWGKIHSLGPIREWTPCQWTSEPVFIGETEENDLGLSSEFMTLSVDGTIETATSYKVSRPMRNIFRKEKESAKTEALREKTYAITRYLGESEDRKHSIIPNPHKRPVYLDDTYMCRDVRPMLLWAPESQVKDYQKRDEDIVVFMDELSILAQAAGFDSRLRYDAEHVRWQLERANASN